jgi:glycerol-3-phosphate acyltransferase PlsX
VTRPPVGRVESEQRRSPGAPALGQVAVPAPGTARIAVDLLGGDHAPAVVVDGALRACQADPALHLLLVGPAEASGAVLAALDPADHGRVSALAAPADRTDLSTAARRLTLAADRPDHRAESWVESGVRAAVLAVAQGAADAVVSAGNTGATVLPTAAGRVVLLDVGSSVDPDEHTLAMHARLGAAYAAVALGVERPRVGLLTIGTERGKGDRLRRAAPPVLAGVPLPAGARYVGLVEGNDVVLGSAADVAVTDGFTGNVLLKGLETAYSLIGPPGDPDTAPARAALLLGVLGTVVVCHGAADAQDLAAGIALAADLHRRAAVAAIAGLIPHTEVANP